MMGAGSSGSGSRLNKLVDHLINSGAIQTKKVAQVMRMVDRAHFCRQGIFLESAYDDCPQGIGFNATISAPHMHAYCMVS